MMITAERNPWWVTMVTAKPYWLRWYARWHLVRVVVVGRNGLDIRSWCGAYENFLKSRPHHRKAVLRRGQDVRQTQPRRGTCLNCLRPRPARTGFDVRAEAAE